MFVIRIKICINKLQNSVMKLSDIYHNREVLFSAKVDSSCMGSIL